MFVTGNRPLVEDIAYPLREVTKIIFLVYLYNGAVPKRFKGAVLKTDRRESVRGFKSYLLRHSVIPVVPLVGVSSIWVK